MSEFDLIQALGVEAIEAPALSVPGIYIAPYNLVAIRAGLSHEAREYCADYLLSEEALPDPR